MLTPSSVWPKTNGQTSNRKPILRKLLPRPTLGYSNQTLVNIRQGSQKGKTYKISPNQQHQTVALQWIESQLSNLALMQLLLLATNGRTLLTEGLWLWMGWMITHGAGREPKISTLKSKDTHCGARVALTGTLSTRVLLVTATSLQA